MAVGRGPVGSEKAAQQLAQLESRLELLRRRMNMYFNGFEKVPPTLEFEAVKREFREFASQGFSTGQSRFKAQNLIAKWQVMRTMWERDLQRMEEGKFRPNAHHASHALDNRNDDIE